MSINDMQIGIGLPANIPVKTCGMLLGERGNRAWLPVSIMRWGQRRKRAEGTTFITIMELIFPLMWYIIGRVPSVISPKTLPIT